MMALATSIDDVGILPWVSVGVSVFTTGFVSATISNHWDTNPENRQLTPEFYGFEPAKKSKRIITHLFQCYLSQEEC